MQIPDSYLFTTEKKENTEQIVFYERDKWINRYLKDKSVIYHDIDSIAKGEKHCIPYYEALAIFLNAMENKLEETLKNVEGYEKYFYECCDETDFLGIAVYNDKDKKNRIFYLKSDQFGFSAPGIDKKHPYDIYLKKIEKVGKDSRYNERIKIAQEKVAGWIYDSRSLGGSFLWPMEERTTGKLNTNLGYNKVRGRNLMKDRVDLTLVDIKNCYLWLTKSTNELKGKQPWLFFNCQKNKNMKRWIEHFGTGNEGFNNYCNFFCFTDCFVEERDLNVKSLNEGKINDFWDKKHKISFRRYHISVLERMFNNLISMIEIRTVIMQEHIEKENINQ